MPLSSGARLGPYEIVSPLGAGGMGEVYKARDTRLDRTVAIKVLPSADPELKARFEREAKSIAALQHPHICALFDVGSEDGTAFLVMEHLEGETLGARLERGALKPDEALRIAVEIVSALDAAHRAGIVHRDLKPGNVMLTKSGAKLLDFGLAKARKANVVSAVSVVATQAQPLTGSGSILGTLQYMSPEQLEGQDADARADIFALGAVLYEMVTGKKAFAGKSQASLIAAILHVDPPVMSTQQPLAPPALDRIVTTCLAKDPDDRWQTARDLLRELKWIAGFPSAQAVAGPLTKTSNRLAWTTAALLGLAAITSGVVTVRHLRETPPTRMPTRFTLTIPGTAPLFTGAGGGSLALALSLDGSHLAYVGGGVDRQLYLRAMDQLEAVPIRGTQGAAAPFFSTDGQWIGFFADAKLKKIPIGGGTAQTLAAVVGGALSGSWGSDDTIVFTSGGELRRIPAAGGRDEQVTALNVREGETSHRWVEILPGGKAVVFVAQAGNATQHRLMIHRLDTGETRMLDPDGVSPHYVSSGHLLFVRSGTLFAAPFDSKELRLSSTPVPVLDGVAIDGTGGVAHLTTAANGSLAYVPGDELVRALKLVWVDRHGIVQPLIENPRPFREAHLSPDGERIAIGIEGSPRDLWIYEIKRGTLSRFTVEPSESEFAAWTPDGKRIAFGALRPGRPRVLRWKAVDGSGGEEDLLPGGPQDHQHPASWSRDGRLLAFTNLSLTETGNDIWVLELGGKSAVPFAKTRFTEAAPMFSPDGRWIAYVSDESGHNEVYVQPYPGPGGKRQVSINGGGEPVWAPDGRELFYRADDKMMVVPVSTQPTFSADAPRLLFEGRFEHPLNTFPTTTSLVTADDF